MVIKYDKIIRDNIPEIIVCGGGQCKTKTVNGYEAIHYLIHKIQEEAMELHESKDKEGKVIEELADILECIRAIICKMSISMERVEFARNNKLVERGGFSGNLILLETS